MKTVRLQSGILASLLFISIFSAAQNEPGIDSTGLPGDNFSLQGALQMFKDAASTEDFEKAINSENNHVNNLDLNEDGETDYVTVIEKSEKDAHVFILRAIVSENENQDIAVIELEKNGEESAVIQIVGDEDIYGEQTIAEPSGDDASSFIDFTGNSNISGPNAGGYSETPIVVNVWFWPSVRFVFAPGYRLWVSPWRWHYYPAWWKPWKPFGWHVWHPFRVHYNHPFAIVHTHRVIVAHRVYTPFRTGSVTVRTRHSAAIGNFRVTRTKTRVTGPAGRTTTVKRTTITGPRGGKATKVKVRRH